MAETVVTLRVNRQSHRVVVEGRTTLLELLRDRLEYRSVRRGCEAGECGACTVLLNGEPVDSCLTLAAQADGAEIITVEGLLGRGGELHPVMEAFLENHGVQCGYCTPGMVLAAYSLVDRAAAEMTEEEVRRGIAGNLCRCTGYVNIVRAVLAAQRKKNDGHWW